MCQYKPNSIIFCSFPLMATHLHSVLMITLSNPSSCNQEITSKTPNALTSFDNKIASFHKFFALAFIIMQTMSILKSSLLLEHCNINVTLKLPWNRFIPLDWTMQMCNIIDVPTNVFPNCKPLENVIFGHFNKDWNWLLNFIPYFLIPHVPNIPKNHRRLLPRL